MNVVLQDRTALVTGSLSGLGNAIAQALAQAGANLVLHGLCTPDAGQAAAERITEIHGTRAIYSGADLRSVDEIETAMRLATDHFGQVDIVVNNAVMRHFKPVEDFTGAEWDASVAVNLSAAFHLARLAVPAMKVNRWGRIINIASIYGVRGAPERIDYVTTKTALLGMTRALAVELARTGITCNAVSPGTVPTDAILERIERQAKASGKSMHQAEQDYLLSRNPTGRFVSAQAVGAMVVHLCGPHGEDITGANIAIDGGWSSA